MWTINNIIIILNKIKEENENVEILNMWFNKDIDTKDLNIIYKDKYGNDVLRVFEKSQTY